MVASDGTFSKSLFAADEFGYWNGEPKPSEGQGSLRIWIDKVTQVHMGSAGFVTFDVWTQSPGKPKLGPVYHSALVVEDKDAPEGFSIKHLQMVGVLRCSSPRLEDD